MHNQRHTVFVQTELATAILILLDRTVNWLHVKNVLNYKNVKMNVVKKVFVKTVNANAMQVAMGPIAPLKK
jgi:hypothetical protein